LYYQKFQTNVPWSTQVYCANCILQNKLTELRRRRRHFDVDRTDSVATNIGKLEFNRSAWKQ